jgi:hypothetical protein
VVISQFRVEFMVENSGKASSSSTAGWTSSKSEITLVGVSDELRQSITDELYDRLVQDLTGAGVEVVSHETLSADEDYKSMERIFRRTQEPVGKQAGKSIFVGAHDTPYYLTNDDKHIGLGTALGGFSTVQPQNFEPRIAESLQATVLRVTMSVKFADIKASKTRVTLAKTILMPADVLTLKDTTTKGEKAAQLAANIVTGLFAGGSRTERHYEATANPEAYHTAINQYGVALESALMAIVGPALSGAAKV